MTGLNKIYAVDDEAMNLDVLEEALSDEFDIALFSSGEACLEACEKNAPDLILLDLMMPGMDGYETCTRIRSMPTLKSTKVIFLSARADCSDRLRGYEVGADDYLTKPFDSDELIAKVRVFLRLKNVEEVVEERSTGSSAAATGVLHDVANVLNSIKVSLSLAIRQLRSTSLDDLGAVAKVLEEHSEDLTTFFSQDKRGGMLPGFLQSIYQSLEGQRETTLGELGELVGSTEHMREIIRVQQSSAMTGGNIEEISGGELLENALQLNKAKLEGVRIDQQGITETLVQTNRHKVLQILSNLIGNALEAVQDSEGERVVTLACGSSSEGTCQISISDTGVGLSREQLSRMFQYGFTTKKDGHGFGLHSASLAAAELGGVLYAHSDGRGLGATVTLELPLRVEESYPEAS